MKRLCLLSIALFLVCAVNAQTAFSVPSHTMEQKLNMSRAIMNNYILSFINVAKSDGMTVEEFGKKCGEVFIPVWDENTGFEQIVNYMLNYWVWLTNDVQIVEQSDEKVVISVPHIYPLLENQGDLIGVSFIEFLEFVNVAHLTLFNHFGVGFDMTWGEEGLTNVITQ